MLQLGPLYNNHLRRWSGHAAALGCEVWAAGHVRPGRRRVDLGGLAHGVEVAPPGADGAAWLRELLERVRPDLIQAHFLHGWAHTATQVAEAPVLATPWGSDVYLAEGAERDRADEALRDAELVIARSPHMERELLARGVPPERIARADLGVDLERFRPPADPPRRPVVLSFRSGTELYNLDLVIEAFGRLRAGLPEAGLVLVHGDAPLAPSVSRLLPAPGVEVLGRVEHAEVERLMREAAVGISIPASDGSPSSVWEALASGLPVVLSDLPQVRERVEGCAAVRLVEPEAGAVAAALHQLQAGDRPALARAGRGWAVANADERAQRVRLGAAYATISGAATSSGSSATGSPSSVR